MDKWEKLRKIIKRKHDAAVTTRDMIDSHARKTYKQAEEGYRTLDDKAKDFAEVLRLMEDIDNDIHSGN
jgi:hypothetical protein